MAEDELDSFDTAWSKYMGDQALMIQPFPEPSADGNLLNQQESIAFSRFFDNLLAQPSSPRRTARRLDEELQRLSDATQPYGGPAEYSTEENVHSRDAYAAHQTQSQATQAQAQQAQSEASHPNFQASTYPVERGPFVASQPVYGNASRRYDDTRAGHHPPQKPVTDQPSYLSHPYTQNGFHSKPAEAFLPHYASAKPPKQERYDSADSLGQAPPDRAQYNYTLVGSVPQETYAADPQLDPQFYPPSYTDHSADGSRSASVVNEAKRARTGSPQSPVKRARTQRGEAQTKVNHMNSEKRRRAHIRDLFDRMCSLVPRVSHAEETLPKSLVLQETHSRLIELETQNAKIRSELAERGVDTASVPAVVLDHDPI